ncbi:S-adenosyl-L-methionine-dependent methyltransferase [Cristinia sonorae]|uniref:S-adenosyl-L-methionine-dependent methyltransferase n=1 Tax=Cristinia sonorae TaxID=1940300 RepID=A0A8K0ULA5_9AGAR|nr:S-adenosyl-L-methionine-dependent methyltransferase [Cristinia sonorae]
MPRNLPRELLAKLSRHLGQESASIELRWLKQSAQDDVHLHSMVSRRISGEPLQYILGTQPFGPLNLRVRAPVLIPRPETEDWTLRLAELIRPTPQNPVSLLDLCTGSGCIPILLCHLWPEGSVHATGVDIAVEAIELAAENSRLCGVDNPTGRKNTFTPLMANVRDPGFIHLAALKPPFHVITSNPPYISAADYEALSPSVRDFEDPRALLGDPEPTDSGDGLTFYHEIAKVASSNGFLADDGVIAVEVGIGQAEEVAKILTRRIGLRSTAIWNDPWGIQRVVVGRR